ncbi:MAG: tetratricopeptide repeat protein [Candidatus Wallbacteria bacterium]|nr:tetratricopeptide repeat protein [Candidatus Wallbacteria bacterium]
MRWLALTLFVCSLPARLGALEATADGQVAALLDPARNLASAQKLVGSGDQKAAREPLAVALELSRVDSPSWAAAMLVAARNHPDLALAMLSRGEDQEVPLTIMPDSIEASARIPFTPPASYVRLDFLKPERRRLIEHLVRTGQEVEATRVIEQQLEDEGPTPPLLLYLAALYERVGELPLALQRYQEAYQKVVIDEDRFAILYSVLRVLYRQGRWYDAQMQLKPYTQLAKVQVTQFVDRVRSSPNGRDTMLTQLLTARRHLVEALNFEGIIAQRKGEERVAQMYFGQALLLDSGRLPIAVNYNQVLQLGGHYETAGSNLARIRQVLTAVATEVQRLQDKSIDGGLKVAGEGYGRIQAALKAWLSTVAVRQGIQLFNLRRLSAASQVFAEATAYDAKEPLAYYYLGLILAEEKKLSEALVDFRKALTFASGREELAALAKKKVDDILEAQTDTLLAARTPEERAREKVQGTLDAKALKPLQDGLEQGRALYLAKRYAEAQELFQSLERAFPLSADPPYDLGLIREQLSDYQGAQRAFEKALKIVPEYVPAMSQLAYVYTEVGFDAREAVPLAEKAKNLAPRDGAVLANLGWVYFYAGDGRRAIETLREAIDASPKVADYHLRLGLVYYRQGLFHFSLSKFQDLLALEPSHPRGTVFLGLSLAKLGRAREALDTMAQALPHFPPPGELNRVLVTTMASLKAGLEARGEPVPPTASVPARGPTSTAIAPERLEVRAGHIVSPSLTPEEARVRASANAALEGALGLLKNGRRDESRAELERAVQSTRASPEVAYPLAVLQIEDGELDSAKALLNAILDANPLDLRATHSLGDIYFREGRLTEYKDILDRSRPLAGASSPSPFLDALAARWKQLLDSGAPDPVAHERIGLIRFHQHRFAEADKELTLVSTSPLSQLITAQIRLHEYYRTKNEIQFQTARDLLGKAGYNFMDGLDGLWARIKSPRLAEVTKAVEKELKVKKRAEISSEVYSQRMIAAAAGGNIDEMDVANANLLNPRWGQITRKIEQTRVARTTYKPRVEPVLEDIELDPGRRFRQPGGPGRKSGPLPRSAMGAAANPPTTSAASTAPTTSAAPATPAAPPSAAGPAVPAMAELPEKRGLAERKLAMGIALVSKGRLIEAKSEFATAVALDEGLERAHTALGLTHLALDETEAARRVLARASNLFAPERTRLQALALLALSAGEGPRTLELWSGPPPAPLADFAWVEESRRIWVRVLADSPGDVDAAYNLAFLAYLDGDDDEALRRVETLRDRTGKVGLLYAAATVHRALGRHDRAGLERGIAILRVAPSENLDGSVSALEKRLAAM